MAGKRRYHMPLINYQIMDKDEMFALRKCNEYLARHVEKFNMMDHETFELLCWSLGPDRSKVVQRLAGYLGRRSQQRLLEKELDCRDDACDYGQLLGQNVQKIKSTKVVPFRNDLLFIIKKRIKDLSFRGKAELQRCVDRMVKMFSLSVDESEFLILMYFATVYDDFEFYLTDHLRCNQIAGFKYLINMLGLKKSEFARVKNGTLKKIDGFDIERRSFCLNEEMMNLLQDEAISSDYFSKVKPVSIPLDFHFIDSQVTEYIKKLLEKKTKAATHILFYGKPGTGKSTFAKGLVRELKAPAYEILATDEENEAKSRRTGIMACLNMTNTGDGSIIIVDEADNLLNTRGSWFFTGETQDKGWLNQIMEAPETRFVWITNDIERIEESVMRRFSYSLSFESFNKRQRIRVWENVLKRKRTLRMLSNKDIDQFARRYHVSASAIDNAVQKTIDAGFSNKIEFKNLLNLTLKSHETLMNYGEKVQQKEQLEMNYSLEGLNIEGSVEDLMNQLDRFNVYLDNSDGEQRMSYSMLFYGPPGTGKSELARYIAVRLDRELIVKRASDLLNMFVGETEKRIRRAFEEAERENAVLVIDEVDTFIFSRNQAHRSWELSSVNEFLTQMERYKGILICTTNRLKGLDEASIRRFNHKISFDFLTLEGNVIFYKKILQPLIQNSADPEILAVIRQQKNLTPGDFKIVRDKFSFYPSREITHDMLLGALIKESKIKTVQSGKKKIGF